MPKFQGRDGDRSVPIAQAGLASRRAVGHSASSVESLGEGGSEARSTAM
jgi:hypothetical protein